MTSEYPCVDFAPERHRQDRIELDPPLRALSHWSLSGVRGSPRIAGGAVFLTFQENDQVRVACHDEHSAELIWSHPMGLGSSTRTTAIGDCVVGDGSLLVSADSEIHVLDARTGEVRQHLPFRGCDLADSALVGDRLAAFGYDGDAFVAAYDLTAQRELWRRKVPISTGMVSATRGIMVFATDHDFHGVDLETGGELWSFSVADLGRHEDPDTQRLEPGRVAGRPPVIVGDQVLGGIVGHHVISLDLRSGALRWARRIQIRSPRALTYDPDGRLYVIDAAKLVSVDVERDGEIASEHAIRGEVDRMKAARAHFGPWSKLAVTERFVYFGTRAALIALDKRRGTAEWMQPTQTGVPPDGGPVAVGHRLYAVDLGGHLQVFEADVR